MRILQVLNKHYHVFFCQQRQLLLTTLCIVKHKVQRTEKRVKFFKLQTVAYTKLHPDITVVHQYCIMVAVCSQSNYILVR